MESPSERVDERTSSACLAYDLDEARLVLVQGSERHEIRVRAQAHRLLRHMVERNAASGGNPALCTHDELMRAVWADEPMHSREELAKLVWELRRKLEPFGAAELVENVRGRGYRLLTCREPAMGPAALTRRTGPSLGRRRLLAAALLVVALGAAAGVAVALETGGSGRGAGNDAAALAKQRTFVERVENILDQAAAGRTEIRSALTAGLNCSISPHEAGQRIASVADNRQSILGQLGVFGAPSQRADDAITYLQQALQQSIEADRHYRDGFFAATGAAARCPLAQNRGFTLAAQATVRATAAKRRFLSAFNPLAARVHRRTWSAGEF
jgi:hypothetical protein